MEIGDILFVDSNNKNGNYKDKILRYFNIKGQYLFSKNKSFNKYRNFHFTHVILSLGKGLFIESIPDTGVWIFQLQKLIDDFEKVYSVDFKVFRNKTLTEEQREKIFKRAEYYLFEKYNNNFINDKNKKKGKSYCSELIKNIYEEIGIKLSNSYRAFPIELYDFILADDNWNEDALDNYKFKINTKNSSDISFSNFYFELFSINMLMNTFIRGTNIITNNFKYLPESAYSIIHSNQNNSALNIDEFDISCLAKENKDNENIKQSDIFSLLKLLICDIKEIDNDSYLEELSNDNLITHWQDKINVEMAKALVSKDKEEKNKFLTESINILENFFTQIVTLIVYYKHDIIKEKDYCKLKYFCSFVKSNFPNDIDVTTEIIKFENILDNESYQKIIFFINCINYINKFNLDN